MKLSQVMDVIREQVGRDKISDPQLDWCVQRGLRELEKRDNFYWMEKTRELMVFADRQQYYLYRDEQYGFNMPNFKETDVLWIGDMTEDEPRWSEVIGPQPIKDVRQNFATTDSDTPGIWTMDENDGDPIISFWPPLPDQDYSLKWEHFQWTTLPTDVNSEAHEVLRRWPEALIYLGTEQAVLTATKDPQLAAYWRRLFVDDTNPSQPSEYKRIMLYQQTRHNQRRHDRPTNNGNAELSARRRTNERTWF